MSGSIINWRVLSVLCSIATLLFFTFAGAEPLEKFRGEPFSDFSYIQQMPPGWEEGTEAKDVFKEMMMQEDSYIDFLKKMPGAQIDE